ncbi:hypothetical protein Tco_1284887 [Tanacetum coccineum]
MWLVDWKRMKERVKEEDKANDPQREFAFMLRTECIPTGISLKRRKMDVAHTLGGRDEVEDIVIVDIMLDIDDDKHYWTCFLPSCVQAIWLREFWRKVTGLERQKVIKYEFDKKSAIALSKNPTFMEGANISHSISLIRECVK